MVIIYEVLKFVGVLFVIVLRVMNNNVNVSDVICKKVIVVMNELGYCFNLIV